MALCNTVHYIYGNYMKDKVWPLQIMAKHAGQSIKFTKSIWNTTSHIRNYMNIPLQTNKKRYSFMARQQQQKAEIFTSMGKTNSW